MCTSIPRERRVQLSFLWGHKMYTSRSIANSQRMITEINKSVAIAKVRILVESDTVKHLKTLRVSSSQMPISLLDDNLVVCRCVRKKIF